ncbi:MAG: secondary thiamine-phosphate synthase enzyme YjbQ [Nanoarchaeota archaeon]
MKIIHESIRLKSKEGIDIINITNQVESFLVKSNVLNGFIIIQSKHTTCSVMVNENENRLLKDIKIFLNEIAPMKKQYLHDDIKLRDCPPGERINAHAHLKSILLNTTEILQVINGKLNLGTWQSIFVIDSDGSRERQIDLQIIGE